MSRGNFPPDVFLPEQKHPTVHLLCLFEPTETSFMSSFTHHKTNLIQSKHSLTQLTKTVLVYLPTIPLLIQGNLQFTEDDGKIFWLYSCWWLSCRSSCCVLLSHAVGPLAPLLTGLTVTVAPNKETIWQQTVTLGICCRLSLWRNLSVFIDWSQCQPQNVCEHFYKQEAVITFSDLNTGLYLSPVSHWSVTSGLMFVKLFFCKIRLLSISKDVFIIFLMM